MLLMKKFLSFILIIVGMFMVLSNIGEVKLMLFGAILAVLGSLSLGLLRRKEQEENNKKLWPEDQEYR